MSDGLLIKLPAPVPVAEPDRPYDRALVWLYVTPRIDKGISDSTVSLTWQPYRLLSDGTIDVAPEFCKQSVNVDSILDAEQADPIYGQIVGGVVMVLQQFFDQLSAR